jgi:hypothetical protein
MTGAFNLSEPKHLLAKLTRELERMRSAPGDVDHAFNFFVTAEAIVDWLHPGNGGRAQRQKLRGSDPLLGVVSHIASGAKHFDQLNPHHTSVKSTGRRMGHWTGKRLIPSMGPDDMFGVSRLVVVVSLSGPSAAKYGNQMTSAIELAEHVIGYWSAPGRLPQ